MEKKNLHPVIDKVLNLIEKQVKTLPEDERSFGIILMVGGFGQPVYLHNRVVGRFEGRTSGTRFVGKLSDSDSAICQGAVSFGLDSGIFLIELRFIRMTYIRKTHLEKVKMSHI